VQLSKNPGTIGWKRVESKLRLEGWMMGREFSRRDANWGKGLSDLNCEGTKVTKGGRK